MKWEYIVVKIMKWEYIAVKITWDCEQLLRNFGEEGWELINIYPYYGYAYFKRVKRD